MYRRYLKHPFPYLLALSLTVLYFALPTISQWVAERFIFAEYVHLDASRISIGLQKKMMSPIGKYLSKGQRMYLVFPYLLLLFIVLRGIFLHTRKWWYYGSFAALVLFIFLYIFPSIFQFFENDKASKSMGHVANGSVLDSKRMYFRGANFTTYSYLCYLLGRTHVHERVRTVMVNAYRACKQSCPTTTFVLGETGSKNGGNFLPHRTHQNGLSVDFMTPLLKNKQPYRNNHIFNLWGYRYEFDDQGKRGTIEIDFEATARHLYELNKAATAEGLLIQKVIFDPVLQAYLLQTTYGSKIKNLPFTKKRVVLRHDDHYHVDFGIPK